MPDSKSAWTDNAPRGFVIEQDVNAWQDHAPDGFASQAVSVCNSNAWVDYSPRGFAIVHDVSSWKNIAPASYWFLPANTPSQTIYVVILRKDTLPDLEVPATSLQIRRRDGQPTYVLAVVPDAPTWKDAVEDYEDGEIIIQAGSRTADGTRHLSELTRAGLDSIVFDQGVKSASLSLSGYRTHTTGNPRPITLNDINVYSLQANGARRIRCPVNMFLRPGDTAVFTPGQGASEESMVVESITILIDPRNQRMDVVGW